MSVDEAEELLTQAVISEVGFRGNAFMDSLHQKEVIRQAAEWCVDTKKVGLMLCGIPGNGKTTLMNAICQMFRLFDFKDTYGDTAYMRMESAVDIANMAKTKYDKFKKLCSAPMLAIDDFGEEPAEVLEYGNVLSPITEMLSIRYNERLLTVLTTNTAANRIRERYGDRIADRFNEMMKVIIFTAPSYRGKV